MKSFSDAPSILDSDALPAQLAALAHPARLAILRHLSQRGSCCCGEVVGRLDLAQSTVSQHLKILVEAGLVRFANDRRRSVYAVDRGALTELSGSIRTLIDECCGPSCCTSADNNKNI
jgi:ArsR family transcriptional regulator, arsenate/arsenite/antimonite-responsive transcriptional repressor